MRGGACSSAVLGLLALLAGSSACRLPSPQEAGKRRCRTARDCLGHAACVEGVCGGPRTPADGGARDGSVRRDGRTEACDANRCLTDAGTGIRTCPPDRCQAPATCQHGLCGERIDAGAPCTIGETDDGCPADAVCLDEGGEPSCWRFPRCPTGPDCPVGPEGSTCIDAPGKRAMCIPTYCDDAGDCPRMWSCVRPFEGQSVGSCSDGSPGSPCESAEDCDSGDCDTVVHTCR